MSTDLEILQQLYKLIPGYNLSQEYDRAVIFSSLIDSPVYNLFLVLGFDIQLSIGSKYGPYGLDGDLIIEWNNLVSPYDVVKVFDKTCPITYNNNYSYIIIDKGSNIDFAQFIKDYEFLKAYMTNKYVE